MRRFKILIPLTAIEAEDEYDAIQMGRQMTAERDWEEWQVTEVRDDVDERYSVEQEPEGCFVHLHGINDKLGPFADEARAERVATFIFERQS